MRRTQLSEPGRRGRGGRACSTAGAIGPGADTGSCRAIDGATKTTYAVQEADVGKRLRMLLTVRNEDGWAWALSSSTSEVAAAPAPEPAPETGPAPGPAPVTPVPVTPAPTAPAGGVLDEQASKPRLMTPVRIRGRLTRSGARITLLTVRTPSGARITLRCSGRGCLAERWARTTALTRSKRFEGAFRAGTKLVITVTKAGRIGKRTTIVMRRGKAPRRADQCLMPGVRKALACPAA